MNSPQVSNSQRPPLTDGLHLAIPPQRNAHTESSNDTEVRYGAESGPHNHENPEIEPQLYSGRPKAAPPQTSSPFEDDEDLFRLESLAGGDSEQQLITSRQAGAEKPPNEDANPPESLPTIDSSASDTEANVNSPLQQHHQQQQEAYLDWILMNADGDELARPTISQQPQRPPDRSQPSRDNGGGREPLAGERSSDDSSQSDDLPDASSGLERAAQPSGSKPRPAGQSTAASTRSQLARLVHKIVVPESGCYTGLGDLYHGSASQSADQRLCLNWIQVRRALIQQQQQNQSSPTADSLGSRGSPRSALARALAQGENHNHCRNPNSDPRGPWCFVAYSEQLDGGLGPPAGGSPPPPVQKMLTHKQRVVRVGRVLHNHRQHNNNEQQQQQQLLVVARECQLASCSEYLWLYVVAPPLGLLAALLCLACAVIRSIRRSHHNAIFTAAYQRHSEPQPSKSERQVHGGGTLLASGLRKLIGGRQGTARLVSTKSSAGLWRYLACGRRASPGAPTAKRNKKNTCSSTKRANYLDDDIFEIVDDIDWSQGRASAAALSSSPNSSAGPKSGESFILQQHSTGSFTNSTSCGEGSSASSLSPLNCGQVTNGNLNWTQHNKSTLSHSKSINPIEFGEPQPSRQQQQSPSSGTANKMSKSKSQAGPMFATLRCHVRNAHQQQQQQRRLVEAANSNSNLRCPQAKKSSSFVEQRADGGADKEQGRANQSLAKTGRLISCSSSSSSGSLLATQSSSLAPAQNELDQPTTSLASELPRLEASSVSVAYEAQPIYEGKFSQVLMAYMRQHKDDAAQATGQVGAQVAVCSLKQQAALDESVFYAHNLRLRNLNHLNLVKLLGYVQFEQQQPANNRQRQHYDNVAPESGGACSLVYDMAHLIDLSDWLKEQTKDEIAGELSLRQNLSCMAKQIALAVDYLHDRKIVLKDLACRNCFLDVTRMLVKLASFNIELEFDANGDNREEREPVYSVPSADAQPTSGRHEQENELTSKRLSLKSMVRPKYLLDYYVIDSRPAECQLLPLSWIPLESILFNKFNKQTDIWSFGCLLYELFSLGEVAYFGYSSKQVIDSVRSNLMPPQPLLCPNGIYKLMCKCLSDIPTLRPNIKQTYEQLNLYTGQCSSFLNHHLCII